MPLFGSKKEAEKPKSIRHDERKPRKTIFNFQTSRKNDSGGSNLSPEANVKPWRQDKSSPDPSETSSIASSSSGAIRPRFSFERNHSPSVDSGDLGQVACSDALAKRTSVLSRTFNDTLHDKDLLSYFIQFLSSKHKEHLIRFWLEAENFTEATLSRIRIQSLRSNLDDCLTNYKSHEACDNKRDEDILDEIGYAQDTQEEVKQDAVNIYSRYIAIDCSTPLDITDALRNATISRICSENGMVDPLCFKECQHVIEKLLNNEYFKDFQDSSFYRKYQVDFLTSGAVQLQDILYNENALFYFMEFMEQEQALNLLQFWMAADNFQIQQEAAGARNSPRDAQTDAMAIYEKYFSLQAEEPLGFSDKVRVHVELNICRDQGPPADCFLIPKTIVLQTMNKTLFPQFLRSQLFYRLLSERVNSSHQSIQKITAKSQKKVGSKVSINVRDGEGTGGAISQNGEEEDVLKSQNGLLSIEEDLRQWKRDSLRKTMSLGRLSELGRFTSELDIDPIPDLDKHKGGRFSKKKKEKEKAQEDMAWQIAKMIISDVNMEVSSRAKPISGNPNISSTSTLPERCCTGEIPADKYCKTLKSE